MRLRRAEVWRALLRLLPNRRPWISGEERAGWAGGLLSLGPWRCGFGRAIVCIVLLQEPCKSGMHAISASPRAKNEMGPRPRPRPCSWRRRCPSPYVCACRACSFIRAAPSQRCLWFLGELICTYICTYQFHVLYKMVWIGRQLNPSVGNRQNQHWSLKCFLLGQPRGITVTAQLYPHAPSLLPRPTGIPSRAYATSALRHNAPRLSGSRLLTFSLREFSLRDQPLDGEPAVNTIRIQATLCWKSLSLLLEARTLEQMRYTSASHALFVLVYFL